MNRELTSPVSAPDDRAAGLSVHEFDVSLIVVATEVTVDLPSFTEMVDGFRRVFHESNLKAEFLVVDDGIGGAFYDALVALNKEIPNFRVIRFRRTFGESTALRLASERARGEFIITNTWYVQVKPEAVLDVIKTLRAGADFVAAVRVPRVDSIVARIQSWGFNTLTRILTKADFRDLNCSFRGYRKHVLEAIHFHGDLFRFVPVLAFGQGFRVEEIEVPHVAEKGPSTFLNFSLYVRRFLDVFSLFFLMKFIKKPLRFFGLTGFGLFFLGLAVGGMLFFQKFFTPDRPGVVDRTETIIAVLLMVLGPILLSIGLIGEIIIFTQGKGLTDYHVDTILGGKDADEDEGDHADAV
jgi:glycosyltransferase involved in cell wall biosynthesis